MEEYRPSKWIHVMQGTAIGLNLAGILTSLRGGSPFNIILSLVWIIYILFLIHYKG